MAITCKSSLTNRARSEAAGRSGVPARRPTGAKRAGARTNDEQSPPADDESEARRLERFSLPRLAPHHAGIVRADLIAGVTVSLVAIPQSLAYAQLAGVPPLYGLYAAFIPAIVGVLFGSSAILSTGPVAMTSLLTAASVGVLVPAGNRAVLRLRDDAGARSRGCSSSASVSRAPACC